MIEWTDETEYPTERLMDYIIFIGCQEWRDCNASTIIGDIIAAFNERTNRQVQLVLLWQDMTFPYLCLGSGIATIRDMLNTLAHFTCSTIVFEDAGVSFVEEKSA